MRTYTPRWRTSALTAARMATLFPPVAVPEGPLDGVSLFGDTRPIILEIGAGHGAAALAYAASYPEHGIVVAEVHVPGVARMLAAAHEHGVSNLRVWRGDALDLLRTGFGPNSLAAVHLFFPDPWPKHKHAKRRLVRAATLDLLHSRIVPGGVVRVATDHDVYAVHVRAEVSRHGGFALAEGSRPPWRPVEGFEAKALRAGRAIHDFTLVRR